MDKITVFEVISYSAINYADLQGDNEDFPKLFPKLLTKLIPNNFQDDEEKELTSIISCSTRTLKDKYLNKMLQAEVIAMTIPDKPTIGKQKY